MATRPSKKAAKTTRTRKQPKTKQPHGYTKAFQLKILRTLFQDPDFALTVGQHVDPSYFDDRLHRWLAKEILTYADKESHGIAKDALTHKAQRAMRTGRLKKEDKDTLSRLITRLPKNVIDRTYVKEEVFRFVKHQVTKRTLIESLDHLEMGDYEAVDSAFLRVLEVQQSLGGGLGHFFFQDRQQRYKRRKKYIKNGIPTGLKIDDVLKPGGLPPKALGCILAPPGAGKTSTLVHIGRSAIVEGGKRVLHVTLEISDEQTADRYDAAFSGVRLNMLEEGVNPKKLRMRARKIARGFGAQKAEAYGDYLVISEFPAATLTVAGLRSHIRQLESVGFYPDLLIVDYADLMLSGREYQSSYDESGHIFQELRKLLTELLIAGWTASQATRDATDKKIITIKGLADSFKKAMVCDVIPALCQTPKEQKINRGRFYLAKNRLGKGGLEFPVKLDWSRQRVINL